MLFLTYSFMDIFMDLNKFLYLNKFRIWNEPPFTHNKNHMTPKTIRERSK